MNAHCSQDNCAVANSYEKEKVKMGNIQHFENSCGLEIAFTCLGLNVEAATANRHRRK